MVNILFIISALILVYLMNYLSRIIISILSSIGLKQRFSEHPLQKSILYMLILGILSTIFLFGISFPFTSRTGFNIDNIELSLTVSLVYCPLILIVLFLFVIIYKKIGKYPPYVPYSVFEDFDYEPYYKLSKSKKTRHHWLIYRWLIPGAAKEILFRGVILTILDFGIKGYINIFNLFNLSYSVIIAQIIYHLAHIRIRFKPFHIKVSYLEQLSLLIIGLVSGVLYYYSQSLIGPIIIHSFYSGISAILYTLFRKKK